MQLLMGNISPHNMISTALPEPIPEEHANKRPKNEEFVLNKISETILEDSLPLEQHLAITQTEKPLLLEFS